MSAVDQTELERFLSMLNTLELRYFDESVMVTAPSSNADTLMVARRESGHWQISIVKVEEVPAWVGPE